MTFAGKYANYCSMDEIIKLKEELERSRCQLHIFYELTKAMRTTLRFEEIIYIILTGLTAHQGLGFNRAVVFTVDSSNRIIKGFMGIGHVDAYEAGGVWQSIENQKMNLYDLIKAYHKIKEGDKPKFWKFVEGLTFPLSEDAGFIYKAFLEKGSLHIKEDKAKTLKDDPLVSRLKLKEFLISSLWIKGRPRGIVLVDNYINQKIIAGDDVKIFNMFAEQAEGAIENSQIFEDALTRAHTDSLTGLWNYGYFQYKIDEELIKAKNKNTPLSLMMVDIDNFKKINDTYGHAQGDSALRLLSRIFKENCRECDYLCRYGGEEFSLILPGTEKEKAYILGERIRKSVEEKNALNTGLTVSIGISSFPADAQKKEEFIKIADEALYKAKKNGKNTVISE